MIKIIPANDGWYATNQDKYCYEVVAWRIEVADQEYPVCYPVSVHDPVELREPHQHDANGYHVG